MAARGFTAGGGAASKFFDELVMRGHEGAIDRFPGFALAWPKTTTSKRDTAK
jgi:hypothetical protein